MTDQELLELAAKAAGMEVYEPCECCDSLIRSESGEAPIYWNPLRDDGEALRLAVKLRLTLGEHLGARHAGVPPCPDDFEDGNVPVRIAQLDGHDPFAATRRAIVRAAAEIGKGMKE